MNILISAVGGQGALLASKVLGKLAEIIGKEVKVSEVHGMSQRGGSVVTYVRMGEKIYSPVVEKGTADYILAFEKIEGARYVEWLKSDGIMIVSSQEIKPMPVITGAMKYPTNILNELREKGINIIEIDALKEAEKAGNNKAVNVVLIGILAARTDIEPEKWEKAISETVPAKVLDVNLKAFKFGYELGKSEM